MAAAGAGASAGAAACGAGAAAAAPTVTRPSNWLLTTVAPASCRISVKTPSTEAETTRTTLSVSISTRTSSYLTAYHTFLLHATTVASATDSGSTGVRISLLIYTHPRLYLLNTLPRQMDSLQFSSELFAQVSDLASKNTHYATRMPSNLRVSILYAFHRAGQTDKANIVDRFRV